MQSRCGVRKDDLKSFHFFTDPSSDPPNTSSAILSKVQETILSDIKSENTVSQMEVIKNVEEDAQVENMAEEAILVYTMPTILSEVLSNLIKQTDLSETQRIEKLKRENRLLKIQEE